MAHISPSSLHCTLSLFSASFHLLTPSKHSHQLLCLFSSAVAIFPSVIDIILGVRSSLFCISYFGGGQWGRWGASLCLCLSEMILLSHCRAEVMEHSSLRMSHLEIMQLRIWSLYECQWYNRNMLFFKRVETRLHLPMYFSAAMTYFFLLTQVKMSYFMSRDSFFFFFFAFCNMTAWLLSSSSYPPFYKSKTALICSHLIQRIPSGFWAQSSRTSKFRVLPSLSSFLTYVQRGKIIL